MRTPRASRSAAASLLLWAGTLLAAAPGAASVESPHASAATSRERASESFAAPRGALVRWGGVIERLELRASEVVIEVQGFPLDASARPIPAGRSAGRFIVIASDAGAARAYAPGHLITVTGRLAAQVAERLPPGAAAAVPVVRSRFHTVWAALAPMAAPGAARAVGPPAGAGFGERDVHDDGSTLVLLGALALAGVALAADSAHVSVGIGYGRPWRGHGHRRGGFGRYHRGFGRRWHGHGHARGRVRYGLSAVLGF